MPSSSLDLSGGSDDDDDDDDDGDDGEVSVASTPLFKEWHQREVVDATALAEANCHHPQHIDEDIFNE